MSVLNLLRLGLLFDNTSYQQRAIQLLEQKYGTLCKLPEAMLELLLAADFYRGNSQLSIVFPDGGDATELVSALNASFNPNTSASTIYMLVSIQ